MNLDAEDLAEQGIHVEHHFCGTEPGPKPYIKETHIPSGMFLGQHMHRHDHLSVLVKGCVRMWIDGLPQDLLAPRVLLLKAGSSHAVEAITDAVWLCVWNTEDTNPETVDQTILKG